MKLYQMHSKNKYIKSKDLTMGNDLPNPGRNIGQFMNMEIKKKRKLQFAEERKRINLFEDKLRKQRIVCFSAANKDERNFYLIQFLQLLLDNKWYLSINKRFNREIRANLKRQSRDDLNFMSIGNQLFPDDPYFIVQIKKDQKPIVGSIKNNQQPTSPIIKPSAPPQETIVGLDEESSTLKIHQNEMICHICMSANINSVILPCYHTYFCFDCSNKLTNCGICQQKILGIKKIYTPLPEI